MEHKSEILAPAGSMEMLIAAVRSGADAVYVGAKEFSARRNAENFDIDEIRDAVRYCHERSVKLYLTLNILIKEQEMTAAFNLARDAYNAGIDGIIIQDLGLARLLHEHITELPLHASTQVSVHSKASLSILKEIGFCRIVVAREMSKKDLIELCDEAKRLSMSVEVFVHGALCMCLSGQCLLSAFLGSRSGNRGLCAGPCRLPFALNSDNGYHLSLKDLSLLSYLQELREIGVESFKIEGRMKRPEYVAAATAAARQSLDNGFVDLELEQTLKNVFSRSGFTDGYYTDKLGNEMFGIRTKDDVLSANDAFPKLHEIYRNERKSVKISIRAEICREKAITLTLSDGENTVTAFGVIPQEAQKKALTYEDVLKNITKLGGTQYIDEGGCVKIDDGLFVPSSALNELRRKAVELLNTERSKIKRKASNAVLPYETVVQSKVNTKPKMICRFENAEQIPQNTDGIDAIVVPLESDPKWAADIGIPKIVDVPRGIISEELLKNKLLQFKENGFTTALCGNLSAVVIAKQLGFKIIGDTGLNIFNRQSIISVENMGIEAITLSAELDFNEMDFESAIPRGLVVYGKIPLMVFKNCSVKGKTGCEGCNRDRVLTDRLGVKFPVKCRMGYSEMLNSVPIWLADRMNELPRLDFYTLYFSDESRDRVQEVIDAYKNGTNPDIKFTRGLYYKGTI